MSDVTIFEKILAGEIPCDKVYEDEYTFAFRDIAAQAPTHILVIPKKKIVNIASSKDEDHEYLGKVLRAARIIAEQEGISEKGYRLVFNNNRDGGQTVDYLHCHLIGGRPLGWPPG